MLGRFTDIYGYWTERVWVYHRIAQWARDLHDDARYVKASLAMVATQILQIDDRRPQDFKEREKTLIGLWDLCQRHTSDFPAELFFRVAEQHGFLASRKGNFDDALDWFERCKEYVPKIVDETERKREEASYYYRLGTIHAIRARTDPSLDFSLAKHSLERALELATKIHRRRIVFAVQNWLADIACWEGDLESAETRLDEIWKEIEEYGEKRRIAAANRTRARIAQGRLDSERQSGKRSLEDHAKRMQRYAENANRLFAELKMYHECDGLANDFRDAKLKDPRDDE